MDGEIYMRPLSLADWLGFYAALYAVSFVLAMAVLRSINSYDQRFKKYTTRPAVGWTVMVLAPLTLVLLILWVLWELVVIMKCGVTRFARLGDQAVEKTNG